MDSSTAAWLAPLEGVTLELKEIENRLADYSAELDCDPQELFRLEERINLLESLKMKYGHSFEDIAGWTASSTGRNAWKNCGPPLPSCASSWTPPDRP